jgi:hypothetical protein
MKIKHIERIFALESALRGIDYLHEDIKAIRDELINVANDEDNGGYLKDVIFKIGLDAIEESLRKIRKE